MEWFEKSALQGNDNAQYNLGVLYEEGFGLDMDKAAKWYRKAAEQGDEEAQYRLASYLMRIAGNSEDVDSAIEWYEKAAERGHLRAKKELRNYYYHMAERYKDLLSDKAVEFLIKLFILLVSAAVLNELDKPFIFLIEFFCIVASSFISRERYRDTESYRIRRDYLRRAAQLGHKRANIKLMIGG